MDPHTPFAAAIRNDPAWRHVAIVHDPFHVMKRATEAIDEMRRIGRGTRWVVQRASEKRSEAD